MSTVFRKPAVPVLPQPLTRPKSKPWLRSVLSSTVWQREEGQVGFGSQLERGLL
jgi:hypothetical protein